MDRKELLIGAIILLIIIAGAATIFAPNSQAKDTSMSILNNGTIEENGTLYVKLTDNENASLDNKTVNVKITNGNGEVVYNESVKTHFTGVAIAKLNGLSSGEYTVEITFDGDQNNTACNITQKITIGDGGNDEDLENSTLIQDTLSDNSDDSSSSASSNPQSSGSSSRNSGGRSGNGGGNGGGSSSDDNLPEYDEEGNLI